MAHRGGVVSNAAFKRQYAAILAKAGAKAELVVRQSAVALQSGMVEKSPVDTGQFKGNWQCGIGALNLDTSAANDPSGSGAIAKTITALQRWKAGQTIYMTNSLPYARRLEFGWSQQAPAGMARLTVMDFQRNVAQIVAGLR